MPNFVEIGKTFVWTLKPALKGRKTKPQKTTSLWSHEREPEDWRKDLWNDWVLSLDEIEGVMAGGFCHECLVQLS